MAFAEVNGARLAWQQMGEGPDLILIHGLATNRAFWLAIAMSLQARFRVTLFDLRGHGYSSRPERDYRVTDFGRDVLGLMDALSIERAALVGHSYGGAAALEAAGLQPHRVSRLGLLDTRVARLQPLMRLHDTPRISEVEKQVAAQLPMDWASLPQLGYLYLEAAARMRVAGRSTTAADDFTPFGQGRGAARAAQAWLDLLDQTTAREELDIPGAERDVIVTLTMPILLMYADLSRCLASGDQLRTLLPQARYVLVQQAGHFFPLNRQALVIKEIEALLR
ncbi:MAG: alpha/beta fold hydrolase [Panacagrimonas sp.]